LWYNESTASEEKAKKRSALALQEVYDLSTIQNHHHTLAKLWAWESGKKGENENGTTLVKKGRMYYIT
jgi:hypothetical protein